jgi:hypothetical protein
MSRPVRAHLERAKVKLRPWRSLTPKDLPTIAALCEHHPQLSAPGRGGNATGGPVEGSGSLAVVVLSLGLLLGQHDQRPGQLLQVEFRSRATARTVMTPSLDLLAWTGTGTLARAW